MMKQNNTAAKPAAKTNTRRLRRDTTLADIGRNHRKMWRSIRIGGNPATKSPDGDIYFGTAAEIREAALTPTERTGLKENIELMRRERDRGLISSADMTELVSNYRREAIRHHADLLAHPPLCTAAFTLAEDVNIGAVARSLGKSADDFIRECVLAETAKRINSTALTRHERKALAAMSANA